MKNQENNIELREGDRVRILVGPFKGVEGTYICQEKRVIIKIEGISGSATMELNASDIEKL
jgi:transcription antitermination factor NusG